MQSPGTATGLKSTTFVWILFIAISLLFFLIFTGESYQKLDIVAIWILCGIVLLMTGIGVPSGKSLAHRWMTSPVEVNYKEEKDIKGP
jgi:cell division protein FtsW (lipid II flippase)